MLLALADWLRKLLARVRGHLGQRAEQAPVTAAATRQGETQPVSASARAALEHAFNTGADLLELSWTSIEVVERDRRFARETERLSRPDIPFEELRHLARASHVGVAAIALVAISKPEEVPSSWTTEAISMLNNCPSGLEPYVYRSLLDKASYPVIGPALSTLDADVDWNELARFVEQRRDGGEELTLDTFRSLPIRLVPMLEMFIDRQESRLGFDFREVFDEWRRTTVDVEFLTDLGRVLERPYDEPRAYLGGRRQELVELIIDALEQKPRRSLLLVGEHGVGKSVLARAALDQLPPELLAFEARAAEVNAGAMWVGELEGRIKELAAKLAGHNVVWLVPGFEETLHAGQHSRSPQGMLDALLPYLERGEITVVGELTPSALENLLAERPRLAGAVEVVRVRPLDGAHAIAAAQEALEGKAMKVTRETVEEAYELSQQFLPGLSAPGNVLKLLLATAEAVAEEGATDIETTDVLMALAASTGLPLAMLDPKAPLDLVEVREFFAQRVLAQPEAIEVIVERIALIKAALADPTRPLGVFLFVGPTGTGKPEIAKALAEFLFGSQRRLVRLDMSEYQTPDALERLLADPSIEQHGSPLLSSVRKEPFAVVLLDEFEKAAEPVWDLFLQLFDDGRLTDQQGRTADFRRCVIIMTSNLGSALAHRPGAGFGAEHGRFREELIERELTRTFRIEFLNRIDRVVVFHPFERAEMRALLEKELSQALARRGLRTRPWAIELDESAIEFLIEQGFSPELGARPLKRALDRHLLTRIAAEIVQQAAPEGDQFLLVSASGDGLVVQFVDPDAVEGGEERDVDTETSRALDVRAVALSGHGDERTARFLEDELARTASTIEADVLPRKETALRAMQVPGFWEDADRHAILAQAEYLDRLEAALHTALKLGRRLERTNGRGAGELAGLLALRLHVLQAAVIGITDAQGADVFLRLHAATSDDQLAGARWVERLAAMYERWAERRGMRITRLDPDEHLYSVSGLGAATILTPESGLHVLEAATVADNRRMERLHALVEVAPWPPEAERDNVAARARRALEDAETGSAVVRRYRTEPTSLVRDAVRGYRTGRIERVLAGDFDLF